MIHQSHILKVEFYLSSTQSYQQHKQYQEQNKFQKNIVSVISSKGSGRNHELFTSLLALLPL
jgi:hypothetical protein